MMNTKNEKETTEPKKKTIEGSAIELKISNKKETPILNADLYVVFTDKSSIRYCFQVSNQKHLAESVASYKFTQVNPETDEDLCDYTLYRKDISPTHTSNIVICPDCKEAHFQWTDTKLEIGCNPTNPRFVDPLTLSLDHISDYDSLAVEVFINKFPEEDLEDYN
jgi:hypothetical protein